MRHDALVMQVGDCVQHLLQSGMLPTLQAAGTVEGREVNRQ